MWTLADDLDQRQPHPEAAALFERHLDLRPLGRRTRGLVRCPFHDDYTPSLSVDIRVGVFHCFGCGVEGGVRKFAELVGERQPAAIRPRREPRDPLFAARVRVFEMARRQPWVAWQQRYAAADTVRTRLRDVDRMRKAATAWGDTGPAWELLALAAAIETEVLALEHAVDMAEAG